MNDVIYLDNNATTKIDPLVLEAMMPFLTDNYANSSSTHLFGHIAHEAVKVARKQVANLIGAETNEIVFTSGATEAINLAIKGIVENYSNKGKHILTVQTEHSAVLDVCKYLETKGFEVTYLPVQSDGLIDLNILKSSLRKDTLLVSVMYVNNETGVIQPIKDIAEIAHQNGSFFMTDATQAVGKIPINVEEMGIDLLTMSAHKFYGPKGVGVLFVKQRRKQHLKLTALLHGGGHEGGKRSGTLNVSGIVGMGKAAEICSQSMFEEARKILKLRDELENAILKIPNTYINGNIEHRLYNTTNVRFEGCDSDAIILGLENIAVSNGSACTSASVDASHVLLAMGLSEIYAFSCIRFSLGRNNSNKEVPIVLSKVENVITSLKAWI